MVTKPEDAAEVGGDVGVAASAGIRVNRPDPVKVAAARSARFIRFWAGLAVVLVIAVGALTFAWASTEQSGRTSKAVQGSCQFYRDLSDLPLAPTSTKPLLTIIADARIAYTTAGCQRSKGELDPPDSRVLEILRTENR